MPQLANPSIPQRYPDASPSQSLWIVLLYSLLKDTNLKGDRSCPLLCPGETHSVLHLPFSQHLCFYFQDPPPVHPLPCYSEGPPRTFYLHLLTLCPKSKRTLGPFFMKGTGSVLPKLSVPGMFSCNGTLLEGQSLAAPRRRTLEAALGQQVGREGRGGMDILRHKAFPSGGGREGELSGSWGVRGWEGSSGPDPEAWRAELELHPWVY